MEWPIGSAHNKGGPADINIAQILSLSNVSDVRLIYINLYSFMSIANQNR